MISWIPYILCGIVVYDNVELQAATIFFSVLWIVQLLVMVGNKNNEGGGNFQESTTSSFNNIRSENENGSYSLAEANQTSANQEALSSAYISNDQYIQSALSFQGMMNRESEGKTTLSRSLKFVEALQKVSG
jgi:hypothetical protein